MSRLENVSLALLRCFDPETAHGLALKALNTGILPLPGPISTPRLATTLAGIALPNPVGLAAGFDKNATAANQLSRAGFGFIELGAATPYPQPGNPGPRLFRLPQDRAAINRFGFNNDGMDAIVDRLSKRKPGIAVGLNLGANKDSTDCALDYSKVLQCCAEHVDFVTVNVSSPNTEKLRELQGKAALSALLSDVINTRNAQPKRIPVFLKIAPDLTDQELAEITDVALSSNIDAIIATNTTLSRDKLNSPRRLEKGGLSGAPLFEKSTRVLARLYQLSDGKLPLIGVGGIGSAADAYAKIKAGASAVQLYTAMVFQGISLAARIAQELDSLLARDGYDNVIDAVGTETGKWL
ncbi:MAG: quinone-dependent dihydroorotate dehydrogenase [Paracoccaceae bacterium]